MIRSTRLVLVALLAAFFVRDQDALADHDIGENQARIEILWPHAGVSVDQATRANLLLYMVRFDGRRLEAICNAQAPALLVARNSEPARWLDTGQVARLDRVAKDGKTFPAWEYQNVDVSVARDVQNRLSFTVWRHYGIFTSVKILIERAWPNVWVHGQDARTYFPSQDVPVGVDQTGEKISSPENRAVLDAKIEIVWPHGGDSVTEADKVNVSAMLLRYGTLYSVPPDFDTTVTLLAGLNQEVLKPVAVGQKRLVTAKDGITYPVWDFNNIDVSAAKDPRNKYFFMVDVASYQGQTPFGGYFSNIWVHGADGRTYFPQMDVPERGCP